MSKIVTIKTEEPVKRVRRAPDISDEQREKRLCDLAITQVEERMRTGKATAAEYLHYLKLASERSKQEQAGSATACGTTAYESDATTATAAIASDE